MILSISIIDFDVEGNQTMVKKIQPVLRENINVILALIIAIPLQLLVLIIIDSTIQLNIFLYIIGIVVILLCGFVIGQKYFRKIGAIIFSVALTFMAIFTSIIILAMNYNLIIHQIILLMLYLVLLIFIESVIYLIISFIGQIYIDIIIDHKNLENHVVEDNEYSAVLIGNNLKWDKNIDTHVGACGLYLLIKYFKNTNKQYIICQKVGKSHFDKFVLDDKCQELYILGHGSKRNFSINNEDDGKIYYLEYKDAPKKRVIAQLHCANTVIGENNESLVDLLAPYNEESYVGNGYIFFFNEWWYYLNIWINNM